MWINGINCRMIGPTSPMQALKNALPEIVVSGFPSINRAVVSDGKYSLLVEGYGLGEVIGAPGVDGVNTTTNHVAEVESVLGIEAARATICSEVSYIMQGVSIAIDGATCYYWRTS